MNVAWVDTETTGLNPKVHGVHEFAIIIVRDKVVRDRRVFHLNPESCEYDEGSKVAHGKTEEEIRAYPPEKEIYLYIKEVLARNSENGAAKMVFAGYNCPFDYASSSSSWPGTATRSRTILPASSSTFSSW